MSKYAYQIEVNTSKEFSVREAKSLKSALAMLGESASQNGCTLDENLFRNAFRKKTMVKVGQTFNDIEHYNIFRSLKDNLEELIRKAG